MMDTMGEKARETKDKTYETGRAARDKAQESKEQSGSYLSEKAQATKEKASDAAQAAREKAQSGKEATGGILEQTGEKVKSMAQGAADAVKSTFGMAQHDDDVDKQSDPTTVYRG